MKKDVIIPLKQFENFILEVFILSFNIAITSDSTCDLSPELKETVIARTEY